MSCKEVNWSSIHSCQALVALYLSVASCATPLSSGVLKHNVVLKLEGSQVLHLEPLVVVTLRSDGSVGIETVGALNGAVQSQFAEDCKTFVVWGACPGAWGLLPQLQASHGTVEINLREEPLRGMLTSWTTRQLGEALRSVAMRDVPFLCEAILAEALRRRDAGIVEAIETTRKGDTPGLSVGVVTAYLLETEPEIEGSIKWVSEGSARRCLLCITNRSAHRKQEIIVMDTAPSWGPWIRILDANNQVVYDNRCIRLIGAGWSTGQAAVEELVPGECVEIKTEVTTRFLPPGDYTVEWWFHDQYCVRSVAHNDDIVGLRGASNLQVR